MNSPSPSLKRYRRDDPRRALVAFAVAVLLHLMAVGFVLLLSIVHLPWEEDRPPPQQVDLRPLSTEQWARNRGAAAPESEPRPRPPPAARKPEEKKEQPPQGQVVAVAPGNEQQPKDSKYLAEKNNTVQKEQKSRTQTPFYRNAMPQQTAEKARPDVGHDAAQRAQQAGNGGTGQDDRPVVSQSQKAGAMEIPKTTAHERIALKAPDTLGPGAQVANRAETADVQGNSERLRIAPGTPGQTSDDASEGRQGQLGIANLMPSAAAMDKIIGAAANDHLDAEEGDATFLNTREWKFASFFNRVKQAVGTHWDVNGPIHQRDPTGNIYGGRDRYTLLNITLDAEGGLREVHVEKSCGVDFLDEAAIAAFQKSQPFPNPPPGLVDKDNAIRFQFGFFLDFGSGPRMRLFRQN